MDHINWDQKLYDSADTCDLEGVMEALKFLDWPKKKAAALKVARSPKIAWTIFSIYALGSNEPIDKRNTLKISLGRYPQIAARINASIPSKSLSMFEFIEIP